MTDNNKKAAPIDLQAIAKLLWQKRYAIIKVCSIVLVITTIYVFSLPRSYKAQVQLAPESSAPNAAGGLSSMASLVGINLGNMSNDAIYPIIYPDVVQSYQFLVEMFSVQVTTIDGKVQTTLKDYLVKHQKTTWWGALFKPLKDFLASLRSAPAGPSGEDKVNPFWLSKLDDEVCKMISGSMTCSVDKKTEVITLTFTAQDPLVTASVTDSLRENLQKHITRYRTSKARNDLQYALRMKAEAEKKYEEAQRIYADYCDSHRSSMLQAYITQQETLENAMQLAFTEYSQWVQQVQILKAKVQEHTPAFTVLQCATVPQKPSAPKRLLTMLASVMFAFFISSVYFYVRSDLFS